FHQPSVDFIPPSPSARRGCRSPPASPCPAPPASSRSSTSTAGARSPAPSASTSPATLSLHSLTPSPPHPLIRYRRSRLMPTTPAPRARRPAQWTRGRRARRAAVRRRHGRSAPPRRSGGWYSFNVAWGSSAASTDPPAPPSHSQTSRQWIACSMSPLSLPGPAGRRLPAIPNGIAIDLLLRFRGARAVRHQKARQADREGPDRGAFQQRGAPPERRVRAGRPLQDDVAQLLAVLAPAVRHLPALEAIAVQQQGGVQLGRPRLEERAGHRFQVHRPDAAGALLAPASR